MTGTRTPSPISIRSRGRASTGRSEVATEGSALAAKTGSLDVAKSLTGYLTTKTEINSRSRSSTTTGRDGDGIAKIDPDHGRARRHTLTRGKVVYFRLETSGFLDARGAHIYPTSGHAPLQLREAALAIGVAYPTIKQWIYKGRFCLGNKAGGHHRIPESEVARLTGTKRIPPSNPETRRSRQYQRANELLGTVSEDRYDGLLAQVTMTSAASSVTSIITRDSCRSLGLKKGSRAIALIKATEVMVIPWLVGSIRCDMDLAASRSGPSSRSWRRRSRCSSRCRSWRSLSVCLRPRCSRNPADALVIQAIVLSLTTSTAATALTVVCGTPLGYLLARGRFRGKSALETLVELSDGASAVGGRRRAVDRLWSARSLLARIYRRWARSRLHVSGGRRARPAFSSPRRST